MKRPFCVCFLCCILILSLIFSLSMASLAVGPSADPPLTTLINILEEKGVAIGCMNYNDMAGVVWAFNAVYDGIIGAESASIRWNSSAGAWCIWLENSAMWATPLGKLLYCPPSAAHPAPDAGDDAPGAWLPSTPETASNSSNRWRPYSELVGVTQNGKINRTFDYTTLGAVLAEMKKSPSASNYEYFFKPFTAGLYGLCRKSKTGSSQFEWLCDSKNYIFLAPEDKASSVTNQQFNYNEVVVNNTVEDNHEEVSIDLDVMDSFNQVINTDDRTFTFVNVSGNSADTYNSQYIDSLYYDFSTNSYSADTYDITYNNDNREYVTNYYTYNITYNISNTYVTYIGSNAAYEQEAYVYYYELPDGRSSADLTYDEVAALSFQFYDCLNYNRSATDTNLRALYHFDGDLRDSGYFSDRTSVTWASGASINYMDSGVFDGALYLDETEHDMTINLPTAFYAGEDFTVQFRYYQASEPDTQDNKENFLFIGDSGALTWDERYLYSYGFPNSSGLCFLPVGNWCEIALVRSSGTLYTYVNGVPVRNTSSSTVLSGKLRFVLGSTSRAYSMLDELRVLNFAIVSGGARYTPTSVPHDSNLVLTLPGTETVTDTYWDFKSDGNMLYGCDFSSGETIYNTQDITQAMSNVNGYWTLYGTDDYSFDLSDGFAKLKNISSVTPSSSYHGLFYGLDRYGGTTHYYPSGVSFMRDHVYTFSVVDSVGNIYSHTFTGTSGFKNPCDISSTSFDWGILAYTIIVNKIDPDQYTYGLSIRLNPGTVLDIVYTELVTGSGTSLTAEKVSCVYSTADLSPNTAAVQTDIPIHGYTVGGVRPTFPARGDVWFMVTGSRVSSVQVYNGSAWESSNARYWTGSRWIPIYAFDIFTLEDCWDIADVDDVITQISTESGFWNWWKGQWVSFRSWLSSVWGDGTAPPSDSSPSPSPSEALPPYHDPDPDWQLADYVSIVREDSSHWSFNDANSFTIHGQPGDLWRWDNTVRNLFLVDPSGVGVSSGDFIWSVDVSGLPPREYNQWDNASVFWYENDDSYYSIGRKSQFDGFTFVQEDGNGYAEEFPNVVSDNESTSCTVVFYGGSWGFSVYVKTPAAGWIEVSHNTSGYINPSLIGLGCWEFRDRGMEVTFSNLRISAGSQYSISDSNLSGDLDLFLSSAPIVPFFVNKGGTGATVSPVQVVKDSGSSLWSLLTGFFGSVFGGVGNFFSFVSRGVPDFFDAFSRSDGILQFTTLGGDDLWG